MIELLITNKPFAKVNERNPMLFVNVAAPPWWRTASEHHPPPAVPGPFAKFSKQWSAQGEIKEAGPAPPPRWPRDGPFCRGRALPQTRLKPSKSRPRCFPAASAPQPMPSERRARRPLLVQALPLFVRIPRPRTIALLGLLSGAISAVKTAVGARSSALFADPPAFCGDAHLRAGGGRAGRGAGSGAAKTVCHPPKRGGGKVCPGLTVAKQPHIRLNPKPG